MSFPLQCTACDVSDDKVKVQIVVKEEPVTVNRATRMIVIQAGMNMQVVAVLLQFLRMMKLDVPNDP